jgi:ElaB/YqjD/DUF883 family membrane-anchored ribosome-binding protein
MKMAQNEFTQSTDVSAVRDSAKALFERGTERAQELGHRAQEISQDALARGKDAISSLERTIGNHPVIAIGTAFVGGLLLGALIVRR